MLKQALMVLCVAMAFDALAQNSPAQDEEVPLNDQVKVRYSISLNSDYKPVYFFGRPADASGEQKDMEVHCRPKLPDMQRILAAPELAGLSFLYGESGPVSSDNTVSVSGNWLKFGLQIENEAEGWILVIEKMSLLAMGEYEGQVFYNLKIFPDGYCGLPFFYVVPDGISLNHDAFSDNPLENLTLYFDGFPGINAVSGAGNTVPEYKIELTLLGRFISVGSDGETSSVAPFFKRLRLTTPVETVSVE